MIENFREIENSYIENFSQREDREDHIIFWDEKLKDMHAFNCILIKENINEDSMEDFVAHKLKQSISSGKDFLKIIFHPKLKPTKNLIKGLKELGFKIQTNLYMEIDPSRARSFKGNESCMVKSVVNEIGLEDGRNLDIETSVIAGMPKEFAMKKALRKKEIFQDEKKQLLSYLCYYENTAVGKCELHIKNEYAKIEDFDVIDRHQKNGFGTAMLKKMISDAMELGKQHIYLITDKEDTPQDMYKKLGFNVIGEEVELFWSK